MGVSSEHDPLYVERIVLLKQTASACYVEMDDQAVADHIENSAEIGIPPARCGRIWLHTHPGSSAQPSMTDEETFARAFGGCDWSVMFILARGGQMYARLQIGVIEGVQVELPVRIDWSAWPEVATSLVRPQDLNQWERSLDELVTPEPQLITRGLGVDYDAQDERAWKAAMDELEAEYDLTRELIEQKEGQYHE